MKCGRQIQKVFANINSWCGEVGTWILDQVYFAIGMSN